MAGRLSRRRFIPALERRSLSTHGCERQRGTRRRAHGDVIDADDVGRRRTRGESATSLVGERCSCVTSSQLSGRTCCAVVLSLRKCTVSDDVISVGVALTGCWLERVNSTFSLGDVTAPCSSNMTSSIEPEKLLTLGAWLSLVHVMTSASLSPFVERLRRKVNASSEKGAPVVCGAPALDDAALHELRDVALCEL